MTVTGGPRATAGALVNICPSGFADGNGDFPQLYESGLQWFMGSWWGRQRWMDSLGTSQPMWDIIHYPRSNLREHLVS